MAQLTGINIQVKSALGVFRAYVKRIGNDKVVQRLEHSLAPNEPISTAFETLRKKSETDSDSLHYDHSSCLFFQCEVFENDIVV